MKGIYIVVVIAICVACVSSEDCDQECKGKMCDAATCWKNKYNQEKGKLANANNALANANNELATFKYRRDQKIDNLARCSKWGELQNLCNVVMSSERTASYPLKCHKVGGAQDTTTTCWLYVNYYSSKSKLSMRNKFTFKVGGEGCEFLHGEAGRDVFLRQCKLDSNLEHFSKDVYLGPEVYLGPDLVQHRRRRLLQEGNADC